MITVTATTTTSAVPPPTPQSPVLLTLPHDALMSIVLAAKAAYDDDRSAMPIDGAIDAKTINSLHRICHQLHAWIQRHWATIAAHYTMVLRRGVNYLRVGPDSPDAQEGDVDLLSKHPVRMTQTFLCGHLHRLDGPARVRGSKHEYHVYGQLHRDGDLPAVFDGYIARWYRRGKLHRDGDLPAAITGDWMTEYWKDGKRHRDGDLPARISIGSREVTWEWFWYGLLHRPVNSGRPAIVSMPASPDGQPSDQAVAAMDDFTGCSAQWYIHGVRHRAGDLPAHVVAGSRKV